MIIIEGKKEDINEDITLEIAVEMAKNLVEKGMSINNAAKETAAQTPFKKGDIYKALIWFVQFAQGIAMLTEVLISAFAKAPIIFVLQERHSIFGRSLA